MFTNTSLAAYQLRLRTCPWEHASGSDSSQGLWEGPADLEQAGARCPVPQAGFPLSPGAQLLQQ